MYRDSYFLKFPCPECAAGKGQRCLRPSGTPRLNSSGPHRGRRDYAASLIEARIRLGEPIKSCYSWSYRETKGRRGPVMHLSVMSRERLRCSPSKGRWWLNLHHYGPFPDPVRFCQTCILGPIFEPAPKVVRCPAVDLPWK